MAEKLKITYATLNDSNEEIHIGYEAGLAQARALMGAHMATSSMAPGPPRATPL